MDLRSVSPNHMSTKTRNQQNPARKKKPRWQRASQGATQKGWRAGTGTNKGSKGYKTKATDIDRGHDGPRVRRKGKKIGGQEKHERQRESTPGWKKPPPP